MSKLQDLKKATTKPDLAHVLGVKPSVLTYCLYVLKTENQYTQFKIPKKTGGERVINAPTGKLKTIQSLLSNLLLDCLDEINHKAFPKSQLAKETVKNAEVLKIKCSTALVKQPALSHGFERKRSIITNAMMHLGKKQVFNIDLEDFFGSFNFGRVRGFFIKNRNFELHPEIATVIAKIACHNDELPQGSPCSPVITNLITHALDIKLARMASKNSCIYTRYADDMTFSSRESTLSKNIAYEDDNIFVVSKKLRAEITRSGFTINDKKTRNQYKDSRQEVTGLVVNKKPNTKNEYWRTARSQCDRLFKTGGFTELVNGEVVPGNINRLEGRLNFIDQVDHYNRLRQKLPLNPIYQTKKEVLKKTNQAKLRRYLHSGREDTFSKFLFYRLFYANELPTILTEGKTDNIYLKAAIQMLAKNFPRLATEKTAVSPYKLLLRFVEYTERTKFLLELHGGADYLRDFVINYKKHFEYYKAPRPENPVIIFVDNDTGPNDLINYVNKIEGITIYPSSQNEVRKSDFVHVFCNLYLVLTPRDSNGNTDIEHFFTNKDRLRQYKGRCFNVESKRDVKNDLSKDAFANHVVHANKASIDFDGFSGMLGQIAKVIEHYDSI
ncbi:retron Ec67 family RNA-directed DNA polymerase/endonuclease [Aeromonas sp. MR19]|uniref:retron Ec67 family RNA-directed DNA polymerase/endonuclease n=1 Tax=Aeromonas sp. MR19 TaxID=2923421 RepID=UPI001F4A9DEA|nr:retron Ec67 family RNA-directed DNA polymerase/endonuclease [Aeromonas sp. MR19]MCH7375919.1 retron Ec67 family RNA-directed DNA polymerase/endonuclease [Aeromonas sp. MR19]